VRVSGRDVRWAGGAVLAAALPAAGAIVTEAPALWPATVLVYHLGLWLLFRSVGGGGAKRMIYGAALALLSAIESSFFFSYYLQNKGFNEVFFYHLRPDLLYAGVSEHALLLFASIACASAVLFLAVSALPLQKTRRRTLLPLALGILAAGLCVSPPARDLAAHVKARFGASGYASARKSFPEVFGPRPRVRYPGLQRPNVVLIYAESLDQRYFDEEVFPGLVPNLKRLRANSRDFSNVAQGVGAGWTVAGMVASQCGYPLTEARGVGGNDLSLFDQFLPNATCLGDLLEEDGYYSVFMGGADARFAGKGSFLRSHGFSEVLDRTDLTGRLSDLSYVHEWGVFDDTLFERAYEKFEELSSEASPFLLSLLTLDTHHPKGFLSKSCAPYGPGRNPILNAVHCSDQLISRFIDEIRASPRSENTVVAVLSDHLAMRNEASDLLSSSKMPEVLLFFVNTPDGAHEENVRSGLHYDLAPTLLDVLGFEVEGQIGFGASLLRGPGYLPGKLGQDGWASRSAELLAAAQALWEAEVVLDDDGIRFVASELAVIFGGREFNIRSDGASSVPESILFLFDDTSLRLAAVEAFPFDRELTPARLSRDLLKNKEKLAFVISRAENLPVFSEPAIDPHQWVFFFGKPGGELFSWGPLTGDLFISYELIDALRSSGVDELITREREDLLKVLTGS
jgi:hypothetical protein